MLNMFINVSISLKYFIRKTPLKLSLTTGLLTHSNEDQDQGINLTVKVPETILNKGLRRKTLDFTSQDVLNTLHCQHCDYH